jgi:Putative adhesin
MNKTFLSKVICLALFLAPALLMGQTSVNKSFNGVKKIRMTTASGSCKIQKSTDASVKVDLQYSYDTDDYEPRMELEGDRLVIKENFNGNNHHGNAKWSLAIPDGITITFTTGSGDLEASGLTIDLNATTGSGDLIFTNLKGEVQSTTGSGNVELTNFSGDIRANTGSGDMQVQNSSGDISLNCGSGDLKLNDNKATFSANTGSGRIVARNLVVQGASKFNTGSGDAEIVLAATPAFDLSVNSGSGDAEVNFNGNEIKGEIVMKASKRHGNIIAPFEFDKTEEIDNNYGDNVTIKKTVVKGNGTNRISIGTGSGNAVLKK